MTSNERKIINFLRDAKEKTHIRLIAKKTNFSSEYAQSLCNSLARAGYIKFEDSSVCHLLKKGQGHFESVAVMREVSEPVIVTANVTLLTNEPAGTLLASDRDDDKADDDAELDKVLADLQPSSQKDKSEEKDKPEELKDETENRSRELEEEKTEEIAEEPKEVLAETEVTEGEKMEKPDETELKPESKAEEEKPAATEAMAGKEKELTEEAKAENLEKVALKEEPAKPSGGFGASFKKIVNWFAEKK